MTGMQLIPAKLANKCNGVSKAIRKASCSSGWLHLTVQGLFAVIIVTCFILLIYMMAVQPVKQMPSEPNRDNRCYSMSCMVKCERVPYFGNDEEDIIHAVSQLSSTCPGVYLTLNRPMFQNGKLPSNWLPRTRLRAHELEIAGGNLNHLTSHVFQNQNAADIRILILRNLDIKTWETDSFVGLSKLKELYIRNCTITNVDTDVLRSVHSTLEILVITNSGRWNPANITGSKTLSHITVVNFGFNNFSNLLGKDSFTGLENCKLLYLNSCNITKIGDGAFDNLRQLNTLYLNDNKLVTIPPTLFDNIVKYIKPTPRIDLHNNNWHCDCFTTYIHTLVRAGVLLTHPVCKQPKNYAGKTFHELVSHCNYAIDRISHILSTRVPSTTASNNNLSSFVYVNNGCHNGDTVSKSEYYQIISPIDNYECPSKTILHEDLHNHFISKYKIPIPITDNWIKFTYFLKTSNYTIAEIGATGPSDYGILWYQSTCPNEVYCISIVPNAFQIFNIDTAADYVFCPMIRDSGAIENEKCVSYNIRTIIHYPVQNYLQIIVVVLIGGTCLIMGAVCVYALVRQRPTLLKGSKRIVFVKHKTVDALVLPPKVPLRHDVVNDEIPNSNNKHIFVLPVKSFETGNFNRDNCRRSGESIAPSYISALQPTELQLSEWRNKSNLANEYTSELSPYSWMCNADTHIYTELIDDKTYESLK